MGILDFFRTRESETKQVKHDAVLPARCSVTGEPYMITISRVNGTLTMVKGERTPQSRAQDMPSGSGVMKKLDLSDGLVSGKTYHCPICGNKSIVRCGKCHSITCYDGSGYSKCINCGSSDKVSASIQSVDVYDANGTKSSGLKPGNKYAPGDK